MVWCCYCKSKLSFFWILLSTCHRVSNQEGWLRRILVFSKWLRRDSGEFWSFPPLQLPFLSAEPGTLEILPVTMRSARGSSCPAMSSHSSLSIPACGPPPSTMRQQPQRASPGLLNGTFSGDNQPWHLRKEWFHSSCLAAVPALPLLPWDCQPGEHFSPSLTSLLCWATTATPSSPPLSLGTLPPKLAGELQGFFCSLVGNFIWPFQVGQEQILDLLTMNCFYLSSAKEVQWKDCSCWAKAPHLLQSSYAFASGTSVKALLTLVDVFLPQKTC